MNNAPNTPRRRMTAESTDSRGRQASSRRRTADERKPRPRPVKGVSTPEEAKKARTPKTSSEQERTSKAIAPKREPHHPASNRPTTAAKASRPPRRRPDDEEPDEKRPTNTTVSSLVKAIIYIMSILVFSGILSYSVITIGNDVFAFVKSDEEIQITVPEGTSIKELGYILADNGVIKYPRVFDFYADLRGKNPTLVAGDYTVSPSMNYDQLINVVAQKTSSVKETVVVVIPEGYTVDQIIDTLVNKYHLSSREELEDAIQNYDFNYWFVDRLEGLRAGRTYRLEGYLYPDTYYYYTDASAVTIVNKMLKNFDTKMKQTFKNCTAEGDDYIEKITNLCRQRNMTFDDMVILASMVQMEAYYDIEYGTVSSVFNNRIKNPSKTGGKLESDATIYYILDERPEELTQAYLNIDSPYNTRLYAGLPPGPITNATYLAINYALYPENTGYYYFVSKPDGYNLFAKTLAEHQKNCDIAFGRIEE